MVGAFPVLRPEQQGRPVNIDLGAILDSPGFAGFVGGLIALRWVPGQTWLERAANLSVGAATAWFCAPAIGEFWHLTSKSQFSFLSFFVGLFGLAVTAAIMQGLREIKLAEIATAWLAVATAWLAPKRPPDGK